MLKKSLITCFFGACAILPIAPVAANPSCFELGLTGGWFKVGPTSRVYGVGGTDATITNIPNGSLVGVNPKYRFGGGGYLNYTPCGQPYAWGISYFTDRNRNSSTTSGTVGITNAPAFIGVTTPNFAAGGASSTLRTNYQYGTITIATTHALCCDVVHIKPHLGIAYLNERESQNTVYTTINGTAGTSITVNENSRFQGWGPAIGTDIKYCFCGDFSLFGNVEYAALLGRLRGSYSAYSSNLGGVARSVSFGDGNSNAFVSQIQTEIGIGYCFNFWCFDRGNIALGWRFTKMFDASRRLDFTSGSAIAHLNDNYRNSNLQGPFIRLAFGF